jgi:diguanylate cyclase (GGDEF)-like protein
MIDFNLLCLLGNFLAVMMSFSIAIFVFFTLPKTKVNVFFTILNLFIGLWCLSPILINLTFLPHKLLIQRIGYAFAIFLVPLFFEVVSSMGTSQNLKNIKMLMYFLSYSFLIALPTSYFIKDLAKVNSLYRPNPEIIYYIFIAYFGLGIGVSIYSLISTSLQYKDDLEKNYRMGISKFLLYGYGLEYIAGIMYFATVLNYIHTYTFSGYIVGAGGFVLFYAVIKHDFIIDSEKKQNAFQHYLTETTKELIELKDLKILSSSIDHILKRNTDCLDCKIYILEKEKYINYLKEDEIIDEKNSLIDILSSQHDIISHKEVKRWTYEIKTANFIEINNFFEKHYLNYIIPLFFGDLIGFICLGPKKAGKEYTELDKKIFDLIGYSGSIAVQNILLETNTIKDDLTQLYNKKYFNSKFREYINLSIQTEGTFTIGFIDFDDFSMLNEKLGHLACDEKLKEFATLAQKHFRIDDLLARWGGEEFVVLLPNTTLKDGSRILENFLRLIEKELNITFSSGMVFFDGKNKEHKRKNIEQLVTAITNESDKNMYQAKNNGKNQIYPNHEMV